MNTCIFHSVNSGLYFWDGMAGLLADGIHDGPEQGFSPMPAFLVGQLNRHRGLFAHTDGVLFTHQHPDHFQRSGLHRLMSAQEDLRIYGPGLPENRASVRPIRPGLCRVQMAGAYILAKDTLHDGRQYRNVAHQSYLICMGGETFFLAGDAVLSEEDGRIFSDFYGGAVDAAFLNLYQLSSPEGQAFLRLLKPRRIFLEHLPFREDDRYHYRSLARQVAKLLPDDLPTAEILSHMSWIDGKAAQWEPNEKGADLDALSGVAQHGSLF